MRISCQIVTFQPQISVQVEKKTGNPSDFPVYVIYIVSHRYIYIHILGIVFSPFCTDSPMPQEVSDTLKHNLTYTCTFAFPYPSYT